MQFQLPQFIETEDKIVGPFSLRQTLYVGSAGIAIIILYYLVQTWLWIFLSVLLIAFALALAFLKINGRPVPGLILSAFSFYWQPQTYVWRPDNPRMRKEDDIGSLKNNSFLEGIVSGAALMEAWRTLQAGTKPPTHEVRDREERFEIQQKLAGDRQAARRVDFR